MSAETQSIPLVVVGAHVLDDELAERVDLGAQRFVFGVGRHLRW